MFDGLLGRGGFSSKCKSLIKLTRTRIDVIRRKRNATLKFLKKDVADLLADGLETNALGRAEGLVAEMCVTSCYDFLDHVCEIILKHLSTMQKNRECPEDCREAVASLIFSAARFSDLPELRELRDIFKDRFGNSLECYVNQKLAEHINPKPLDMEKKLNLLENIALEFSITWNRSAFEKRNKASEEKQKAQAYLHPTVNKYKAPHILETIQKIDSKGTPLKKKIEVPESIIGQDLLENEVRKLSNEKEAGYNRHKPPVGPKTVQEIDNKGTPSKKNIEVPESIIVQDLLENELRKLRNEKEAGYNRHKPPVGPKTLQGSKDPSVVHRREFSIIGHSSLTQENGIPGRTDAASTSRIGRSDNHQDPTEGQKVVHKVEHRMAASQVKAEPLLVKGERHVESVGHVKHSQDNISCPMRKLPGEEADSFKSSFRSNVPPPYVKPNKSKHKSSHSESDTLTFGGDQNIAPVKDDIPHYTVEYYKGDTSGNVPTPRRRSRRRHHKQSSIPSDDDSVEEVRVVRRVSTSRRRNESKKGLQVLFDDDHNHHHHHHHHHGLRDEEEKVMDKLLLHYCKKPASGGEPSEKSRRTKKDEGQHPSRSMSLPHEQSSTEMKKVFARAASFDQEASTPAKHVHPKLPDYDDLASRFAALRRK